MIGDISRAEAEAIAEQLTSNLPQGATPAALPAIGVPDSAPKRIAHPATQSHILLGMPSLSRGDPDFFALTVGNYVLGGGGFVSRLMNEVREKRGLAYSVYSYFMPLSEPGPFQLGLQTKKEQANDALKLVNSVVANYVENGPTAAELKAAKDNLAGGFALRIDNNRKILDNLSVIGFYKLPLDYLDRWVDNVERVTVADVKAAFARHVKPAQFATVVVGAPD
jgi:zinc protease